MTLFDSESQYREKAAIWRMFSLTPLWGCLAGGRMFRWFAVNIPMHLGNNNAFTSDLDIVACLNNFPVSKEWIFKTWEVKVSLLRKDGTARSIKAGKLPRILTQLRAYRNFGAPDISLLDMYICQDGFMEKHPFPPQSVIESLGPKMEELHRAQFGYHMLPFEHSEEQGSDVGLTVLADPRRPLSSMQRIMHASVSHAAEPFSTLAKRLDNFFDSVGDPAPLRQIVYCRECRQLHSISMAEQEDCPACGVDLIAQS